MRRAETLLWIGNNPTPRIPETGAGVTRDYAPLIGRESSLIQALATLEKSRKGIGQFLLLTGSTGVGKTRLLAEVAERADGLGFRVIHGRPGSPEGGDALQGFLSGLLHGTSRPKVSALARRNWALHHILQKQGAQSARQNLGLEQLIDVIQFLIQNAPDQRPVLWVLDDIGPDHAVLHQALTRLVGLFAEMPLMILAAARTGLTDGSAQPAWWHQFGRYPGCMQATVPGLALDDAVDLAQWALGGKAAPRALGRLPEVQTGIPLIILQMARQASRWEAIPDVGLLLRTQLDEMEPNRRMVIEAAAMLGYDFDSKVLSGLGPVRPDLLWHEVDALIGAGWLERAVAGRLRFCHPLAREIAYEQVSTPLQKALHLAAGHVMAALPQQRPDEIAIHFEMGMDWQSAQQWYRVAAEEAQANGDLGQAARHLRSLLHLAELAGALPEDTWRLADRASELFMRALDLDGAAELAQWGLAHSQKPEELGVLIWRLARLHYYERHGLAAYRLLVHEAIRLLLPAGTSLALAEALVDAVHLESARDQGEGLLAAAQSAVAVIKALGDTAEEVRLLASVAQAACRGRQPALVNACLAEAEERLRTLPKRPSPTLARGVANLLHTSALLADFARCDYYGRLGLRLAEKTGDSQAFAAILGHHCRALAYRGDVGAAQALLRSMEHSQNTAEMSGSWRSLWFAEFDFYQGDLAAAQGHALRSVQLSKWRHDDEAETMTYRTWLAQVQMARGEAPSTGDWPRELVLDQTRVFGHCVWLTASQVYLSHGDVETAQLVLKSREAALVEQAVLPWLHYVQGLIHQATAHPREALRCFRKAAASRGIAYYRSLAAGKAAEVLLELRASGRDAAGYVRRATALFERIGNRTQLAELGRLQQKVAAAAAATGLSSLDQGAERSVKLKVEPRPNSD